MFSHNAPPRFQLNVESSKHQKRFWKPNWIQYILWKYVPDRTSMIYILKVCILLVQIIWKIYSPDLLDLQMLFTSMTNKVWVHTSSYVAWIACYATCGKYTELYQFSVCTQCLPCQIQFYLHYSERISIIYNMNPLKQSSYSPINEVK